MANLSTIRTRVAQGVELLDQRYAEGPAWWQEGSIDLDTLNIACGDGCVVAQLGRRDFGRDVLHLIEGGSSHEKFVMAERAGFFVFSGNSEEPGRRARETYRQLTARWVEVINERRRVYALAHSDSQLADENQAIAA